MELQEAVAGIKRMIETAIKTDGVEGKNNLIRSQRPIGLLHEAVKTAFIKQGVNPLCVHPPIGTHAEELRLSGFFKQKDQDVCLVPVVPTPALEVISSEGLLFGKSDIFGKQLTERILSVNVRSRLSSAAKNFDTLYERTFAEALNLHLRCPAMVLGEVYLIPVYEYDDELAKLHRIGFKDNDRVALHVEKYLRAFSSLNGRSIITGQEYKYERVCLIIVDFNHRRPQIYTTDAALRRAGLLQPSSRGTLNGLQFDSFAADLLTSYSGGFTSSTFTP